MKLIVDTLENEVYQTVRRDKNTNVIAVRPHLYRHFWPTGFIRAVIENHLGDVIVTGDWVSISDIGTLEYFHGYVKLDIKASLIKNTNYRIKIEAGEGYSFSESSYVGVCNGYDLGRYEATYDPGTSGYLDPLDIEIWELK